MSNGTNAKIRYQGSEITLWSDEKKDYFNLTEIANAIKGKRKSIKAWLKNKQTLEFLRVWERKHNPNFKESMMDSIFEKAVDVGTSLSIKFYKEETGAEGIWSDGTGTYAHKDIAIKFAAYLSPELELYIIEEVQRLKELERQKNSYDLLNHEQILALIRLKEVFKYVVHQELIENAHKEVFASQSESKNPFAEFHNWRNKILDIGAGTINERIMQYCIDNNIALTKKMLSQNKREKVIMLDTYDSVRNAVWDFLSIQGEVNALSLANLVSDMMRTEKGDVIRKNEDDLFHKKQDLGEFSDFEKQIGSIIQVKSAREVLAIRDAIKNKKPIELSNFNQNLTKALNFNPRENNSKEEE